MQKISTLELDTLNFKKEESTLIQLLFNDKNNSEEPSDFCINNILNYSKNLEVKQSSSLGFVDYLRS